MKKSSSSTMYLSEQIINLGYLQTRYPILFRALRYPQEYRCNLTYWGIECGNGWLQIVDRTAAELEVELGYLISRIKMKLESGDNDIQLGLKDAGCLDKKFYELKESGCSSLIPYCRGIRESEGQLEFEMVGGHLCDVQTWERIRQIIKGSQEKASCTCERCGSLGELQAVWWKRVLCGQCKTNTDDEGAIYLAELISK